MAVTVNLKPKVDLPVWEWCRPLPVASTAISCTCHSPDNRYIYYIVSAALYRYDTITDSWNQLASALTAPATLAEMEYSTSHGHYGGVISGSSNTVEIAALQGNVFVGKKIKIIAGRGAGQERTITAVSDPVIRDRGVVTGGASTTQIVDTSTGVMLKQWRVNQWRDYQVRVLHGTGANNIVRPVLYNNYNTLSISDVAWASVTPWWGPTSPVATSITDGARTLYQIESNIVTVDSNWDIIPDASSQFLILSDGIWLISSSTSAPFYTLQYYDVAADMWFTKTGTGGAFGAALGTDVAIEVVQNSSLSLLSGTFTAATSAILTDTSKNLTPAIYTNYELRVLSGVAAGETRTILSNTSSTFIPIRSLDVVPEIGAPYEIHRDVGKIYIIGNNASAILQYDIDSDFTYTGKRFDWGVARAATATLLSADAVPVAITGIVRTTGGISVLDPTPTAAGTGYLAGQILTITTGGTGGTARILAVDVNGGVTQVALETSGSGYTAGTGRATTVAPTGGSGCTLSITTIAEIATVTTAASHYFRIGDIVNIAGAAQAAYNGNQTIISQGTGAPTTATTFSYVVAGSPTTPATYTNTQAATTLFDVSKNWITNEHIGKLVVITTAASPNATAVIRRITANTSNSLTFATITTAPTNSTHRYAIISDKAFGTDESMGSVLGASTYSGRGRSGVATSGTTTSLTDSSKNWPVNYWSNTNPATGGTGRRVRITKGTGAGTEMVITSNTATTLNFTTQAFVPDQTSVYVILDSYGLVTTGGTTTLTDNTQNWGTNIWSGKRVRITGGTGAGSESVINSNTQTVLTIATSITTDATSTYAILAPNNKSTGISMFDIIGSSDINLNNKYIYMFRGGVTNEITRYNIVTEEIDNLTYFPFSETLTTGSMYAYDEADRIYFQKDATGRIMYYDIAKNTVENSSTIPYGMSTAIIGNRMEISETEDGLKFLYVARHSAQEWWRTLLYW
jgi:hypothetical protein